MSEEAKWYVIHTYSGYENKVAKTIEMCIRDRLRYAQALLDQQERQA